MRAFLIAFLIAGLGACASPSTSSKSQPDVKPMAGTGDMDTIRLKTGETIQGKIVRMDDSNVAIETGERVRVFARRDVLETSFGNAKDQQKIAAETRKDDRTPLPPSSWYPRISNQEAVTQAEIDFFEPHATSVCLGQLAKPLEDAPELVLFAEPNGKIRLHDPRRFGYHAHVDDRVEKPVDKPGLTIAMPKNGLPQSIAFVSPAQEMKSVETPARSSYAIPDAFYVHVKPLAAANATLAAQPFAGGKAKETADGTLWAFSIPRNDRQCFVYLFDSEKKHGKVLEQSYATYGDAILAPDLILDMVAADGTVVGRVLLLPIPDGLSADGPAPEPIQIRVGKDAAVEASVVVPPREAIVLPPRAPSTKADVYVNFYEVSAGIGEKIIVAWGTGRPDKDVTLKSRDLTQDTSDEHVRIDLSNFPDDRFPAVAWLYHRRTFVWHSGGFRAPAAAFNLPPAPKEKKPTKVITNQGRLAHVLPILFVGPNPDKARGASPLDSPVAGGMTNALMNDALARELGAMGAVNALATLGSIGANSSSKGGAGGSGGGGGGSGGGGGGDSATNITNLYIVIPPHVDGGLPDGGDPRTRWVEGPSGPWMGATHDPYNLGQIDSGVNALWNPFAPNTNPALNRPAQASYDPTTGTTTSSYLSAPKYPVGWAWGPGPGQTIALPRRTKP